MDAYFTKTYNIYTNKNKIKPFIRKDGGGGFYCVFLTQKLQFAKNMLGVSSSLSFMKENIKVHNFLRISVFTRFFAV